MTKRTPKLLTLAAYIVASISWLGLAWSTVLWNRAATSSPRVPNKLTGNVYRRNIHGLIVYQTYSEYRKIEVIDLYAPLILIGAFVTGVAAKNQEKYGNWIDRGNNRVGRH